MLKVPPNGEQAKAMIASFNAFEKEAVTYFDVLPPLEQVYRDQAGLEITFGPKSYKLSQETECPTIVLENLKTKGFANCDRLECLDMEHAKAALKKMAQFHAASAYLYETKGKYPQIYEWSIDNEQTREVRRNMYESFLKMILSCIEQYNNADEYIENLRKYFETYTEALTSANAIDWTKFNVLNHGDCWTNNIMFQHDEHGHVKETYFVDFQLTKYGSPSQDLLYFLMSSPKLEIKLDQFDYFVRYYHENLKASLELLKYPNEIPSLRDLHIELLSNGLWGNKFFEFEFEHIFSVTNFYLLTAVYTVTAVMAAVLLDPSDKANLEQLVTESDDTIAFRKQMYLNKRYRSHAEVLLPWLCRKGFLDVKENC